MDHSRRSFLKNGAVLGAGAALGGGLLIPAVGQAANIKFAETSCGLPRAAGGRILVAYASRCGSTGGVAEAIGRELCKGGARVDVRLLSHVKDIRAYRAVIVGSAVRRGAWLPEAIEFVEKHKGTLQKIPTAYFLTCLALSQPQHETRRLARKYMNSVLRAVPEVKPRDLGMFSGTLDYGKLSLMMRMIMRSKMRKKGIKAGDYRNWKLIRTWARGLKGRLAVKASAG
ncbi:MAG: flavodoxin domain-containing protein [Proteobacteria bacterium]|nr:flavodoxin domain-containing protein [Pseudomonadota bacterium]MBU1741324.1 flavodoxin domain-containing protein [Pseudomonadota bacterium]